MLLDQRCNKLLSCALHRPCTDKQGAKGKLLPDDQLQLSIGRQVEDGKHPARLNNQKSHILSTLCIQDAVTRCTRSKLQVSGVRCQVSGGLHRL